METENLKSFRLLNKLSQDAAIQRIHETAQGKVSCHRRQLANAERDGTRDILLLEAMSVVYGVDFERIKEANDQLRQRSGNLVQKTLQTA